MIDSLTNALKDILDAISKYKIAKGNIVVLVILSLVLFSFTQHIEKYRKI